ncbi:uncharacterized protein LOC143238260 [Tachypleus tridentatus]|uniref:uncharacterized protein LOC143238260 n=1 Tax=Tachypleus tridentatus TaxID=6853 RepID=UPI003FD42564
MRVLLSVTLLGATALSLPVYNEKTSKDSSPMDENPIVQIGSQERPPMSISGHVGMTFEHIPENQPHEAFQNYDPDANEFLDPFEYQEWGTARNIEIKPLDDVGDDGHFSTLELQNMSWYSGIQPELPEVERGSHKDIIEESTDDVKKQDDGENFIPSDKMFGIDKDFKNGNKDEVNKEEHPSEEEVTDEENSLEEEVRNNENPSEEEVKNEENLLEEEVKNEENPLEEEVKNEENSLEEEVRNEENPSEEDIRDEENPLEEFIGERNPSKEDVTDEENPSEEEDYHQEKVNDLLNNDDYNFRSQEPLEITGLLVESENA